MVGSFRDETQQSFKEQEKNLSIARDDVNQRHTSLKTSYDDGKAKGIMMSNVEKIPAVESIGNEISKPDDFGIPTSSYHTMKNPSVSQPSSITVEKPSSTKDGASITSISSPARPQETSLPHNTPPGERVSSGA